jgi:phenylpyruvate tautomerase PptA (4-oxalocrotonate tautomerase family)
MPLVRIELLTGRRPEELTILADDVHQALVETLGVPERDRFQIITERDAAHLRFDRSYLDMSRSDRWILVEVTLSRGRSTEVKQAFFARLAELLERDLELPGDDLAVVLVENERDDWSFGRGEASYVVLPRERWR